MFVEFGGMLGGVCRVWDDVEGVCRVWDDVEGYL